ncbi:hypothetical protein O7634_27870 [Micromonospora sp. WMMD1120]|uniref:hypothetical protein n=1 Tax=Micromonospora sp. WMMD1120 TaxID=3016106 RepID=UPI002416B14D|nr:hypothetical protein [Micromonospora sp. WMMD1120]MDG4810590.1 hypothetical protein [Micromonospora sp. WMMD1120]
MRYQIHFEKELPAAALRQFLNEDYGISPDAVYIGRIEDRAVDDPRPIVMLNPPDEDEGFGWILTGDTELVDATGQGEQELAATLARAFGVRALVDDGSIHPDRWLLVSTDGSSGRVITDEDAAADGDLRVVHALEPISGEPQLAVVPPPDWARDW